MAIIARKEGWSLEEAERRLRPQFGFSQLLGTFARQYRNSYSGGWVDHADDRTYRYVRFVGSVPPGAQTRVDELGLDVEFLSDARHTREELDEWGDAVTQDLIDAGFVSFSSGGSVRTQGVEVELTRPEEYRNKPDSALMHDLPPSAREEGVDVTFTDSPLRSLQVYGGGEMFRDSTFECTSGFVVSHDSGTRGVSTAGHCSIGANINRYRNPETGAFYNAPQRGQCVNQCAELWGDFQWHETSQPHLGHFYWNTQNDRQRIATVVSQYGFASNDYYCNFGRSSGETDCGIVLHPNRDCVDEFGLKYGNQVIVESGWNIGGDSGGPWFFSSFVAGTTAQGTDEITCFSRAANMDNTPMGIDVVARDRKVRGDFMLPGGRIWSPFEGYMLEMQHDGNLVVYGAACPPPYGACWDSGTGVPGSWAAMQDDGNFVIYSPSGLPLWDTSTSGGGNKLILQEEDGNLVIYSPNETPLWACC